MLQHEVQRIQCRLGLHLAEDVGDIMCGGILLRQQVHELIRPLTEDLWGKGFVRRGHLDEDLVFQSDRAEGQLAFHT